VCVHCAHTKSKSQHSKLCLALLMRRYLPCMTRWSEAASLESRLTTSVHIRWPLCPNPLPSAIMRWLIACATGVRRGNAQTARVRNFPLAYTPACFYCALRLPVVLPMRTCKVTNSQRRFADIRLSISFCSRPHPLQTRVTSSTAHMKPVLGPGTWQVIAPHVNST
jgi:hypothetical protein